MNIKRWAARGIGVLLAALPVLVKAADDAGHGAADDHGSSGIAGQLHLDGPVILAQAVGFLVMFAILWMLVFRRVGSTLDQRRDDIASRLAKIEDDQRTADEARAATERRLAEVEREAQQRIQEAAAQAEARGAEIVAEAQESAQAEVERGRQTIAREKNAAILELRSEVADLVLQATRQILDETLDESRQRRLVDQMIERLPSDADA